MNASTHLHPSIALLREMIATPSVSRDETAVADLISRYLADNGAAPSRLHNNLWVASSHFNPELPTLMLNSHIDTVRPSDAYTRSPFDPAIEGDRLYGLGSNDAGASVVSLIATFLAFRDTPLAFNLLLAISAEEEVGGENGMRALLPHLAQQGIAIDMAIVGEPTGMEAAVGERGLVVLDCVAHGRQGHAARSEGDNAIYHALDDIATLRSLSFPKVSQLLGPVKITVTQVDGGWQHNVVPDVCRFVVDVRTTDAYTNEETIRLIRSAITSEAKERSTRIRASAIDNAHPLVQAATACGASTFVSPTTSDMALMPFPSLKIGPGQSARSHQADEYILLSEITGAIDRYSNLLNSLNHLLLSK